MLRKISKKRPVTPQNKPTGLKNKAERPVISETAQVKHLVDPFSTRRTEHPLTLQKSYKIYEVGDLIAGQFEVMERLEGSMAYVYRAYDKIQDIRYAIKQPKSASLAEPEYYSKFLKAAKAWSELRMHPHIATCYFMRNIEDVPLLFVEYVDGSSLREWIRADECGDLRLVLNWAIQVCLGMEKAHESDLLHGDLKPENILINPTGVVQVTDLGIKGEDLAYQNVDEKPLNDESGISLDEMMGTLAYMSPEQLLDSRQRSEDAPDGVWYDSDIYSFGICLWEMILNRLPYRMAPFVEGMPDLQDLRIDIPESLTSLLTQVIAFDRAKRPQDFGELREALNNIYQELFHTHAPNNMVEQNNNHRADELNNRGVSYIELKDFVHAINCFEQAIEIFPTHPQSIYNLSLIKWRSGEITDDEALSRVENFAKDPTVERQILHECIAQLQAERFDLSAAKALLEDYPGRYDALFGSKGDGQVRCLHTLEGHRGWINSVAILPDGSRGLSGSDDTTVRLWNLETGECLRTLEGHAGRVNAVALTPDGHWVLSASDDKLVRVWDTKTGEDIHRLEGHESKVTSLAVSADGWLALSGSDDKTLKLWNLKSGKCAHTLYGHTSKVCSVALTPDGKIGLSGSNDKTLRFWDMVAGQCVATTEKSTSYIRSVALTADGKRGLYSTKDGTSLSLGLREQEMPAQIGRAFKVY